MKLINKTSVPSFRAAGDNVPLGRQIFLPSDIDLGARLKVLLKATETVSAELKIANDRLDIHSLLEPLQTGAKVTKLRGVGKPMGKKVHVR